MRALDVLAADPVLTGFGLDFAWLSELTGERLRDLAGGALAVALIACGVATVIGVVAVIAGKAGLPVSSKAASLASGAVTTGLLGAIVLGAVAGAMAHFAGITVGW
jgi:ABC-type spermidine/putrescine transport system permease subunit II